MELLDPWDWDQGLRAEMGTSAQDPPPGRQLTDSERDRQRLSAQLQMHSAAEVGQPTTESGAK